MKTLLGAALVCIFTLVCAEPMAAQDQHQMTAGCQPEMYDVMIVQGSPIDVSVRGADGNPSTVTLTEGAEMVIILNGVYFPTTAGIQVTPPTPQAMFRTGPNNPWQSGVIESPMPITIRVKDRVQ